MKHVIIGTAGHVDHGKTLLVKALTGIDTDRLIEEKKRGITIELGFAHLDWPDGTQAGIVDVPGHEKFIKNMLAGAGGIDLAMLIIAADDGIMPQTIEHLNILTLLGIKDGLIVITKSDTVDPEWLEMMQEEIEDRTKGTFLEGKPIVSVSAYTGQGISELKEMLRELVHKAENKNLRAPFRLPIDRVFSVEGFGTVVTGTLIEGSISKGETAVLVPSGTEVRIRNLQVHGKATESAYAGQRVAVNLANLKTTDVQRGETLAKPGSVRTTRMLDVRLQNLKDSGRIIRTDSQVHLYHGASVLLTKVILIGRDELPPGESCYAQLRLTEPLAAKKDDRFVIRFYSPVETIGGGIILDENPKRYKRSNVHAQETLRVKESGSSRDKTIQAVTEFGRHLPVAAEIAAKLRCEEAEITEDLMDLCASGRIREILPGRFIASEVLDDVWTDCYALLKPYHEKNPLHSGMKVSELRQKLFKATGFECAEALLEALRQEGKIKRIGEHCALMDFHVVLTKRQKALRERLLEIYHQAKVDSPLTDDVILMFSHAERPDVMPVLESLCTSGELVMLAPHITWHRDTYDRVFFLAKEHFENHNTLTLAEFRDLLCSSRKYALAALEYYDRNRYTRKDGESRRLLMGFPDHP